MDTKKWQQIESILDETFELDEQARIAYIHKNVLDEELKREILSLIDAEKSVPAFLDGGVDELLQSDPLIHDIADSLIDREFDIDRYKIDQEIGRGGMSVVYRARRTDGEFDQQVAVKIMQPFGADREDRFRRLRDERQILANLNHPNIANVFDGGITPEGWPYMVMELVDGVPLTVYCNQKKPGLEDRLQIFLSICDAVNYAHQNLVLHRDLKPGNILITTDGRVKLLDFGIAKLLDEGGSALPITQTGTPLLTPEYAAPEQFRKEPATTSVDVYSLGVLLYELLAGVRPFDLADKSFFEINQIIQEQEPAKPSDLCKLQTVISSELKGDLDLICLKALRKEPEQRYPSVRDLSEDITRYLSAVPIMARPATKRYRIRKFVQRNRAAVVVAAFILIVITGFISALIYQQSVTIRERDRAQAEAIKAQEITEFMLSLFEASDPSETRGDTMRVNEFLERGLKRVDQLNVQPDVQADMLELIGRAYKNVSLFEDANSVLSRTLDIRKNRFGELHPDVANSMVELGSVWALTNQRVKADSIYHRALTIQEQVYPSGIHPDIATTLGRISDNLIHMRRDSSDIALASSYIHQALEIRHYFSETPQPALANDLKTLSKVAHFQNNRDLQERLLNEALEIELELLGEDHPETIATISSLGVFYYNAGKYDQAEEMHQRALNMRKRVFGELHPQIASTYNNLAMSVMAQRDFERAAGLFDKTITIYQQAFGEHNYRVAAVLNNSSQVYMNLDDFDTAIQLQEKALEINLMNYDENHHEVGSSYYLLSMTNRKVGDYDDAIRWAEKSLEISRRISHDLYIGWDLLMLSNIYEDMGDFETTEKLILEGKRHERVALPENHFHIASSNGRYARFLMKLNRAEEAEPLLRDALDIRMNHFGPNDLQTLQMKTVLGECLANLGRFEESENLLTLAYDISNQELHEKQIHVIVKALVDLYQKWQKPDKELEYKALLTQSEF